MLQVALGGSYLVDGEAYSFESSPEYKEPGFNLMNPLSIEISSSDIVYILIRKRTNEEETEFENISTSSLQVSIIDSTNGEGVSSALFDSGSSSFYPSWETDPSLFSPILCVIQNEINISAPIRKIRDMDCYITDASDNSFIFFKIKINDNNGYFNYIHIVTNKMFSRKSFSAVGNEIFLRADPSSDSYLLFSPYNYLKEVSETVSFDFSYPLNTIFYNRQKSFNEEDFDFEILSYGQGFLQSVVSLCNIPNYHKAAVLLMDRYLYNELEGVSSDFSYIVIQATGKVSGVSKNFTIRFIR